MMNICILHGNLTRDVELRYLPKGTAVGEFGLAINRKWTSESGQEKEEVTFVNCTCFGRTAEVLSEYLRKGDPLIVHGRLKLDTWEDKQTRQNRQALKVIVESFSFCGQKKEGGAPAAEKPTGYRTPPGQPPAAPQRAAGTPAAQSDAPPEESDDVPF